LDKEDLDSIGIRSYDLVNDKINILDIMNNSKNVVDIYNSWDNFSNSLTAFEKIKMSLNIADYFDSSGDFSFGTGSRDFGFEYMLFVSEVGVNYNGVSYVELVNPCISPVVLDSRFFLECAGSRFVFGNETINPGETFVVTDDFALFSNLFSGVLAQEGFNVVNNQVINFGFIDTDGSEYVLDAFEPQGMISERRLDSDNQDDWRFGGNILNISSPTPGRCLNFVSLRNKYQNEIFYENINGDLSVAGDFRVLKNVYRGTGHWEKLKLSVMDFSDISMYDFLYYYDSANFDYFDSVDSGFSRISGKININTCSAEVLNALLFDVCNGSDRLAIVSEIIENRNYTRLSELIAVIFNVSGVSDDVLDDVGDFIVNIVTFRSNVFLVKVVGEYGKYKVDLTALVDRGVLDNNGYPRVLWKRF